MKKAKLLIACGSGIATSTVIAVRVKELCEKHGYQVHVEQVKIVEVEKKASDYDLIISSAQVPSSVKTPSVLAVNYLTGINEEKTDQEIVGKLREVCDEKEPL